MYGKWYYAVKILSSTGSWLGFVYINKLYYTVTTEKNTVDF